VTLTKTWDDPASYVSVTDALGSGALSEATLIAGARGLDRVIQSVTVMDTPEIEQWLRGGELLLTNAYVLKDEQTRLVEMLESVNAKGVSAVGLKVREFIQDSVPKMVEVCDRLALPLISVPPHRPWVDIITPVFGLIVDRQVRVLKYALEVHERTSEVVLQGGGLKQVAEQMGRFVNSPIFILDANWSQVLAVHGPPPSREVMQAARDAVSRRAEQQGGGLQAEARRAIIFSLPGSEVKGAIVTMAAGSEVYGYLLASRLDHRLGAFDLVALEQGALAASLDVLRARTEKALERRLRDTFLFDVLSGHIGNPDLLLERAKARGWDLTGPRAVIILSLDQPTTSSIDTIGSLRRTVIDALPEPGKVVWLELSDGVILCVPAPNTGKGATDFAGLKALGEKLKGAAASSRLATPLTIGIGRVHGDPMGLPMSYREATKAIALGRNLWGGDRVVLYEELGLYRILMEYPSDSGELQAFCGESLGPLVEYDDAHGSDLTRTLEVYLDCLGSWSQAAEVLCVHPNTLGYRIGRISELLGANLKSPEQRLTLELALKIRRMHNATEKVEPPHRRGTDGQPVKKR
jgi:purine catabolism regulator